MKKSVAVLTQV